MKLPKGMFQRGRSFYVRLRQGRKVRWISLGRDREEADRRLLRLRNGEAPLERVSVSEAADRWLKSYVAVARNSAGVALTETRIKRYLVPGLGVKSVGKVTPDVLRDYRLWLEGRGIALQTVAHLLDLSPNLGPDRVTSPA